MNEWTSERATERRQGPRVRILRVTAWAIFREARNHKLSWSGMFLVWDGCQLTRFGNPLCLRNFCYARQQRCKRNKKEEIMIDASVNDAPSQVRDPSSLWFACVCVCVIFVWDKQSRERAFSRSSFGVHPLRMIRSPAAQASATMHDCELSFFFFSFLSLLLRSYQKLISIVFKCGWKFTKASICLENQQVIVEKWISMFYLLWYMCIVQALFCG